MRALAIAGSLALATLLAGLATAPGAGAAVPRSFHGVALQAQPAARDGAMMKRGGVGAVRLAVPWRSIERVRGRYDWSRLDASMRTILSSGAEPLLVIFGKPAWIRGPRTAPPLGSPADQLSYRLFLTALVGRYGSGGTFPIATGLKPVRRWQVWNEPNHPSYFGEKVAPTQYAKLLKLSSTTIRLADPRARIVLAGMTPAKIGMDQWKFLGKVFAAVPSRLPFDEVALHPYGRTLGEVGKQARKTRAVLKRAGAGKLPMAITEVGWGSAGPRSFPLAGTPKSQAKRVTATFRLFARKRRQWRISSVYWFAWRDAPADVNFCSFCTYMGLFEANGRPKPAWRAFKKSVKDPLTKPKKKKKGKRGKKKGKRAKGKRKRSAGVR